MVTRLTSAQRCVLADCTRQAILGWLLTDPEAQTKARRVEHRATMITGFSFPRFADMAMGTIGSDYRPGSDVPGVRFPLTLAETFALANDIELEMATDEQLFCAGIIAARSPYAQPEVCSRDWRTFVAMLEALKLSIDGDPSPVLWRDLVRDRLLPFRRAVAAAAVSHPVSAE